MWVEPKSLWLVSSPGLRTRRVRASNRPEAIRVYKALLGIEDGEQRAFDATPANDRAAKRGK